MAEIIWTEAALTDLDGLTDYLALDEPKAAASGLVHRVFSQVELLAQHPELGRTIPALSPSSRYRHLAEPPCRLFYRHDKADGKLYILGIMRGETLFQKRLLQRRDKPRE